MKLSKLNLILSLLFISPFSYAGVNDCVQSHADGTRNCEEAKNKWTGAANGMQSPFFQDLIIINSSGFCYGLSSYICGSKFITGPIGGWSCYVNDCNKIIQDFGDNKNGTIYEYFYPDRKPIPGEKYGVAGGTVNNVFSCPPNYTLYKPFGDDYFSMLCKPPINVINLRCPQETCSDGKTANGEEKLGGMSSDEALTGASSASDPVDSTSGNKYVVQRDYYYNSSTPLQYIRTFNSYLGVWRNNWDYTLTFTDISPVGKTVVITMPNGSSWVYKYNSSTNNWDKNSLLDNNELTYNSTTGDFTYKMPGNNYYIFTPRNSNGLVANNSWKLSSLNENNKLYNISYSQNQTSNNLYYSTISNNLGSTLKITKNTNISNCNGYPVVTEIEGVGGVKTTYSYDTSCRLTRVTNPDNTYKDFTYSTYRIDTIKDELGSVVDKTTYNSSSVKGTYVATSSSNNSANTINKIAFSYSSATNTTVTDANSNSVNIGLTTINGQIKTTSYSSLCSWCSGIQGSSINYNSNGYISNYTDFNNVLYEFGYDSQNRVTSFTEAKNTSLERVTTIEYNSDSLPTKIVSPSAVKVNNVYLNTEQKFTYDNNNNISVYEIVGYDSTGTTQINKTFNYTYNNLNQLVEVKNPMYANNYNDKITYDYNSTGQVNAITNGLNQVIEFSNYNNFGQAQTIKNINNITFNLTYNSRGFLTEIEKKNIPQNSSFKTSLERNAAQIVTKVYSPDLSYKEFVYDSSQRLTEVKEYIKTSSGYIYNGKIVYTLDNMSNITKIQVLDSSGVEIRLSSYQYNNKNFLYKDLTSLNYANTYTYDNNGNLTNINNANNNNLVYAYDSLNRISSQTNFDNGVINYNYNPDDSIASIIDPKNLSTSYSYDGFGNLVLLNSPDTGNSNFVYNLNGDVTSTTDAKNITTSYSYDVLHRPTSIDYPGTTEDVSITYDSCSNGVGKTCSLTDSVGSVNYSYDNFARLSSNNQTISSYNKTVSYSYDANNRLSKITYPSGLEVNYEYYNNKVNKVTYSISGNTYDLITDGEYETFDSNIKSYKYGPAANNISYNRVINKDGLTTEINTSVSTPVNKDYVYDSRLNVSQINGSSSSNSSTVSYDNNSRITSYDYGTNNIDYSYNSSGDRLSKTENTNTTNYNYSSTSHRLNSLTNYLSSSFTYDDNGNTVDNDNKNYTYNNANRLVGFSDNTQNYSYYINPLGQRIKKTNNNNSTSTYYVYDAFDRLIAEYDENDNLLNEYIYLNSTPIALRRNNNIYYIYPDDLGTPRHITDASNNPKWSWDNVEPFGDNSPNENISGTTFKFNLRFPGQYYDEESGLSYNFYRDYNAQIGRYNESDPIGLSGGINTYSYVENNSLMGIDFFGLNSNSILFNENDKNDLRTKAKRLKIDETNNVFAHANDQYLYNNLNTNDFTNPITAKQLANRVKNSPGYDPKKPVKIFACNIGLSKDYCQIIANILQNEVICPINYVWYFNNKPPKVIQTNITPKGEYKVKQVLNGDKAWQQFYPKK